MTDLGVWMTKTVMRSERGLFYPDYDRGCLYPPPQKATGLPVGLHRKGGELHSARKEAINREAKTREWVTSIQPNFLKETCF